MKHKLADYPFAQESDDVDIVKRQYRFGYIANIGMRPKFSGSLSSSLGHWVELQVNTLSLLVHPESPVYKVKSSPTHVVLVGHIFDALNKEFDSQKIAEKLAAYNSATKEFLGSLDSLAGRYVIFINFGRGWEVYPDAFGSKMRYFSPSHPGLVASHSSLLANACGAQLDFDMFAFISSESYRKRDVKNLPGLATEYEDVYVAPANHMLELTQMNLERFWPRHNVRHNDMELAAATFIQYLDGYSDYIAKTFDKEIFGLTGGMDSRTMLAPLLAKGVEVESFTLLRGGADNRQDLETAKQLAISFGFAHTVVNVSTEASRIQGYFADVRKALRMTGGPQRLNTIHSNDTFYRAFKDKASVNSNFSRGFGGEIIRGFFQKQGKPLKKATAEKFAGIMGINGQEEITKHYFQHFIDNLSYDKCYDADLFDIYYMEHRMSKWGANALTESDLTAHSMVGMSCRKLYEVNMGLPLDVRGTREVFKRTVQYFAPELLNIEVC
ncbi:hypothetical protein CA267_012445 [Alteromonas pelagimontana]|uniref:Asparagine synthetase domain-containing protein n=1 Tax=Alteromonas pelagimontana TaxID=1858656 RepID=A0A6M4MEB4_9ALTE|nr:hypothetical protein [Alteromonas pelagimontana]QJR81531.1 hypothetical protein CA267_012445 [Alteromonas pelagimontana]